MFLTNFKSNSTKEYFVYFNGKLLNNKGYYSSYGVSANTIAEAKRVARYAKNYYNLKWKDANCFIKGEGKVIHL